MVVAIVTNNNDPEGNYRVKLNYPWLDENIESGWARVATFDAGNLRGGLFPPEVNDEVLVAFEHGDFRRPFVVGRLWNGVDKPPMISVDSSGKVNHREYRRGWVTSSASATRTATPTSSWRLPTASASCAWTRRRSRSWSQSTAAP